jgi:hypothetical protein
VDVYGLQFAERDGVTSAAASAQWASLNVRMPPADFSGRLLGELSQKTFETA